MKTFRVILLLLSCLVLGGCSLLPSEEEVLLPPLVERQADLQYDTAQVERGYIAEQVSINGVLTAQEQVSLYFDTDGLRLSSMAVKAGDRVKAGDVIAQAESGDLSYRIAVQRHQLRLAEIRLEQSRRADKEARQLEVDIEQLTLDRLEAQLADCQLLSQHDGLVLFVDNIKRGEIIEPFRTIATIAASGDLAVYAQSASLRKVRAGMPASLTAGDQAFQGEVVLSPDNAPASADLRLRDAVIIRPEEIPPGLDIGALVHIQITVAEAADTLLIPKRGLRTALGQAYVQVLDAGVRKEHNVETGLETTTMVEIRTGLSEGMTVILK